MRPQIAQGLEIGLPKAERKQVGGNVAMVTSYQNQVGGYVAMVTFYQISGHINSLSYTVDYHECRLSIHSKEPPMELLSSELGSMSGPLYFRLNFRLDLKALDPFPPCPNFFFSCLLLPGGLKRPLFCPPAYTWAGPAFISGSSVPSFLLAFFLVFADFPVTACAAALPF